MNTMNGKKNLKGIPDLLQFRKKNHGVISNFEVKI